MGLEDQAYRQTSVVPIQGNRFQTKLQKLNSKLLVTGFTAIYILLDFSLESNFTTSRYMGIYHNHGE